MLGMLQGLQGGGGGTPTSATDVLNQGRSSIPADVGGTQGQGQDFLKRFMAGAGGMGGQGGDFASRFRQGAGAGGGGGMMQMLPMILKLLQFNGGG